MYKPSKHLAKAAIATGRDPEDHEGCKALASVLSQVGDKWTILVVGVLSLGSSRFNALQRAVPGISHRMLTHTLRGLERDGLVKRTAFAEIPPRVEYELTLLGRSLTKPLAQLAGWASANQSSIETSRLEFDTLHHAARRSGSVAHSGVAFGLTIQGASCKSREHMKAVVDLGLSASPGKQVTKGKAKTDSVGGKKKR